jgi:hypothetical protein
MGSYIAGEIFAYIIITYIIYWTTKKLATHITKKPLTKTQKTAIAIASTALMITWITASTILY